MPYDDKVNVKLDHATAERLKQKAEEEERTVSQQVRKYVRDGLRRDSAGEPRGE